jgi:hypothetical protein
MRATTLRFAAIISLDRNLSAMFKILINMEMHACKWVCGRHNHEITHTHMHHRTADGMKPTMKGGSNRNGQTFRRRRLQN